MMGQKGIAVVKERNDGGCGGHKKWLDSGYILNVEQSECTSDFVWHVRKKRLKDDFKHGSGIQNMTGQYILKIEEIIR